ASAAMAGSAATHGEAPLELQKYKVPPSCRATYSRSDASPFRLRVSCTSLRSDPEKGQKPAGSGANESLSEKPRRASSDRTDRGESGGKAEYKHRAFVSRLCASVIGPALSGSTSGAQPRENRPSFRASSVVA